MRPKRHRLLCEYDSLSLVSISCPVSTHFNLPFSSSVKVGEPSKLFPSLPPFFPSSAIAIVTEKLPEEREEEDNFCVHTIYTSRPSNDVVSCPSVALDKRQRCALRLCPLFSFFSFLILLGTLDFFSPNIGSIIDIKENK